MKAYDYDCPIEATLSVIGGKWKASIIYYLLVDDNLRFTDLMTRLETVSGRMLSRHLSELHSGGIIDKKVFPQVPPKVEYSLTPYGRTLAPIINLICAWDEKDIARTGKKAVFN